MRVAIYLRVSTEKQEYDRQKAEIEQFCGQCGHEIVHVFEEKLSGADDSRPEFNRLCDLTKDDIDAVVCWEFSRISRKLSTAINAIETFKEKGIDFITIKEHFKLFDGDGKVSQSSMITMSLLSTMAAIERETIVERAKSGKLNKLRNGESSPIDRPPFGYRKENKQLVIYEPEAEVVRKIYHMYITEDISMKQLSKVLDIPFQRIRRILDNEVYSGRVYSKVLENYATAPQIVSVEDYTTAREKCVRTTVNRQKSAVRKYSLRQKVKCPFCNHSLSMHQDGVMKCDCGKSNIMYPILMEVAAVVVERVKVIRSSSESVEQVKSNIEEYRERLKMLRTLQYNTRHELDDATAKLELLKGVFGIDKLKAEVAEVKRLERTIRNYDHDVVTLKYQQRKLESALQQDIEHYTIDDITERVTIHRTSNTTKRLIFTLTDGIEVVVDVNPYRRRYEIV